MSPASRAPTTPSAPAGPPLAPPPGHVAANGAKDKDIPEHETAEEEELEEDDEVDDEAVTAEAGETLTL